MRNPTPCSPECSPQLLVAASIWWCALAECPPEPSIFSLQLLADVVRELQHPRGVPDRVERRPCACRDPSAVGAPSSHAREHQRGEAHHRNWMQQKKRRQQQPGTKETPLMRGGVYREADDPYRRRLRRLSPSLYPIGVYAPNPWADPMARGPLAVSGPVADSRRPSGRRGASNLGKREVISKSPSIRPRKCPKI